MTKTVIMNFFCRDLLHILMLLASNFTNPIKLSLSRSLSLAFVPRDAVNYLDKYCATVVTRAKTPRQYSVCLCF